MPPHWKWSNLPLRVMLVLVGGVVFLAALLPQLAATALTSPHLFHGGRRFGIWQLLSLWRTPDPSTVTGSTLPGAWHWTVVIAASISMVAGTIALVTVRGRRSRDPQRRRGLAPRADVLRELGPGQLLKRAASLRPALRHTRLEVHDLGLPLGTFLGIPLWLRIEDPTIVIGPSRAGKGWYLVLRWILAAPGAVVTTSAKLDNALLTMRWRERAGSKVWIFAPGVEGGDALGHVLRWDVAAGCVDEATLVRRIHALIPGDAFAGGTTNGGHWDTVGQQLASHLFHAAACLGVRADRIWSWVSNPQRALEAVKAIREHPNGLLAHANALEQVINMPAEQRAPIWGTLSTVLAFMDSGLSRKWMDPAPGEEIDLVDFILNKGTLYLVGDQAASAGYKRLIDGLLAEIDYVSKGLADASPGARLDPPLSYILDEAGNFEYQGLYELVTAGGGRGRLAFVVFQSRDQLDQWGSDAGRTMWDAAVAKIILPGGGDPDQLNALARLAGDMWIDQYSRSYGHGSAGGSISEEKRAVIEPHEIRELAAGHMLLFYRNLKPVIARLTPFHQHRHYQECRKDMELAGEQMRLASPFAAHINARNRAQLADLKQAERSYA